jgi:alanine-glyoxylate transaminase/serine-glyoxylate transaminase/serine-pyruvate transaminase
MPLRARTLLGPGPSNATVWRIGLMGHNARPDTVTLVPAALKEILGR